MSSRPAESAASWRAALWVLPAVVPVMAVLIGGLGSALLQSLGLMPLVGAPALTVDAPLRGALTDGDTGVPGAGVTCEPSTGQLSACWARVVVVAQ